MRWAASTSGCQPVSQTRASLPGAKNTNCMALMRASSGASMSALMRIAARTSGGLGLWPTLAATRLTARTSSGRAVASIRATRLPKAWPTTNAGPLPSCSITAAMSAARSSSFDALPRPGALADAARLRPQHAKARVGEALRDRIEIARRRGRATAAARSADLALRQHFETGVAARHHEVTAWLQRRSWNATSAPSMIAPPSALQRRDDLAEQRRAEDRRQQRLEIHDQRAAERPDAVDRDEQRQHRDGDDDADHEQARTSRCRSAVDASSRWRARRRRRSRSTTPANTRSAGGNRRRRSAARVISSTAVRRHAAPKREGDAGERDRAGLRADDQREAEKRDDAPRRRRASPACRCR